MDRNDRQNYYRSHLLNKGIECGFDDDEFGELWFTRTDPKTGESRRLRIILLDDEEVLKVALLDFVKLPPDQRDAHNLAQTLCCEITFWVPVAKWFVTPIDTITAESQIFVPSPAVGCQMLDRCCSAIELSFFMVRRIPELHRIYETLQAIP